MAKYGRVKRAYQGAGKALQSTKRRLTTAYQKNKKSTMIFTLALVAGVAAYAAGYIKFNNPNQNS